MPLADPRHRFYALEYSETVQQLLPKAIILAGSHWAKTARSLLLENIDRISVENLMVSITVLYTLGPCAINEDGTDGPAAV